MNIQPGFNEYKAMTYLCQYFWDPKDQYTRALKQAVKEAFGNNMDHQGTMKEITKRNLNTREFSVYETIYDVLSELKLRRVFAAVDCSSIIL